MILTTHALTGAVIGKTIGSPWVIIIVSLVVHFLLDTLRHGEYLDRKSNERYSAWKVTLDLTVAFLVSLAGPIIIFFYIEKVPLDPLITRNIIIGVVASVFPDLLTLLYWKGHIKWLKKIYDFHIWVHKYPPFSPEREWTMRNAANDIIISAISIFFLLI